MCSIVRVTGWHILLSVLLFRCASVSDNKEAVEPAKPAYYTLRGEKTQKHPAPLPDQTDIFVDWKYTDGSTHSGLGFRAWDIDHDGRFDALEVLDENGQTASWAFDFEGDGRISAKFTEGSNGPVEGSSPEGLLEPGN